MADIDQDTHQQSGLARLKGLMIHGRGAVAEGRYDLQTHSREVRAGANARDAQTRMASLHEMYHAYLNDTTGFGTCLILAGALTRRDPVRFEPLLIALLQEAIGCHEAFATAASLFVVSGGGYDARHLDAYPDYRRELDFLAPILEQAPHPALAHLAIENLARAAMQTGLDHQWCKAAVEVWPASHVQGMASPDARFEALISPGFLKVLFRAEPALNEDDQAIADRLKGGDWAGPDFKQRFDEGLLDGALDAFGHLYFRLAQHRLRSLGAECLDYNAHTAFTAPLLHKAAEVHGDDILREYQAYTGQEDETDLLIGDFAHETLILSPEKKPATLLPSTEIEPGDESHFLYGPEEAHWVQLVAIPKARLAGQYSFDAESRTTFDALDDDPLTMLRKRQSGSNEIERIDLMVCSTPHDLKGIAERWGHIDEVVTIATVRALQSDPWRKQWMPIFQSFGALFVLMDADPFQMMNRWARLETSFHIARASLQGAEDDSGSLLEIVLWKATGEDLIFIAPVSGAVAAALIHKARQSPQVFIEDSAFLEAEHDRLSRTLTHLVKEERSFGFAHP